MDYYSESRIIGSRGFPQMSKIFEQCLVKCAAPQLSVNCL